MWYRSRSTLAAGLLVAAIGGCGADALVDGGQAAPTVLVVNAIRVSAQPEFSYPIVFYGRIQTSRRSSLSFEFAGQISELLVDEGQTIAAGQPMARLDTEILQAERKSLIASRNVEASILQRLENGERKEVIAAARASVLRLKADTERAIRNRNRLEKLNSENVATKSDYEKAYFEVLSLQAAISEADARLDELVAGTRKEDLEAQRLRIAQFDTQLDLLETRIKKSTIYSPFDAHVLKRTADEGVIIQSGEPVFVIAATGTREAKFSLPIPQVESALNATTIRVGTESLETTGCRVVSSVSVGTRAVDVVYDLAKAENLVEGQTCELPLVVTVQTKCFELPMSALVPSVRGLWSVYRLEKGDDANNYRVLREDVTINHTDGKFAYVEGVLPEDSLIVRDGVHKLVPGMTVRVKDEGQ